MTGKNEVFTTEIPRSVKEKMSQKRELFGFEITRIDKTDSGLQILRREDGPDLVRNSEVPKSSAAVWEFVHSYVPELFSEEVRERLFGVWDRPQVAPILQKEGQDRIYHQEETATVYSQMMGLNTLDLARALELDDLFLSYNIQSHTIIREERWLNSVAHHLTRDMIQETKWLDPTGELDRLLESYWNIFFKLNADQIERKDLLEIKELRRQDMGSDDPYRSSLALVETNHQICSFLRAKYHELQTERDDDLSWREAPADQLLTLLLHLHQTNAQQTLLWWLGVAHGHLHLYNSVSRITEESEHQQSPVQTTIIDFDQSRVSAAKLAENYELYETVDTARVKQMVHDGSLQPELRLLSACYLPLAEWEQETIELLQAHQDKPISTQIAELISQRLARDVNDPLLFTTLAQFLYQREQAAAEETGTNFYRLVLKPIGEKPDLITNDSPDLQVLARFYQEGVEGVDLAAATSSQRRLLLSAIFRKDEGEKAINISSLSREDLSFTLGLVDDEEVGRQAAKLMRWALDFSDRRFVRQLLQEAYAGDVEAKNLIKDLLQWLLSSKEKPLLVSGKLLMMELVDKGYFDMALHLIEFADLDRATAAQIYRNLLDTLNFEKLFDYEPTRQKVIAKLKEKVRQDRGKAFVLLEKLRATLLF